MKRCFLLPLFLGLALTGLPSHAQEPPPAPLTLAEAHAAALRNHPRVAIAQLRSLISQQLVKQDQAAYFPSADAFFDAVRAGNANTRLLAGGFNNPVIYDRVADGLGVSELITDFGQTKNMVAGAKLSAKAEEQNAAATNEEILLNVDVNYYHLQEARAVLRVARDTTAARRTLVSQVSALAKNRLRSDLDVSFAQVSLEQSLLLLQQTEGDANGAEASLSSSLGYRALQHFELSDQPILPQSPSDVSVLIDSALDNRPDLLRLRYQRDAAGRYAVAEKDRNYPKVLAVGEAGNAISHDNRLPNKFAAGGVTVDLPLFAGGAYAARQRTAELQAQIADQTLRDQEDNVSRDVRMAWLNLNTALQKVTTTEQLLKHSNQAFSLAQARYKIGSSSIVELSDAQVNATSAEIANANARYEAILRKALLDYETGTLK